MVETDDYRSRPQILRSFLESHYGEGEVTIHEQSSGLYINIDGIKDFSKYFIDAVCIKLVRNIKRMGVNMPQEYTFLRRSMSYKHFELRDSSGVVQTLNAERVRALLSSGRAVIRGLKLSSDNKILIDKNEWNVAYTGDYVEKAQSEIPYPNAHIESYSGTALKEHIETNLVGVSECRDFVKSVISILTQPIQDKRVLGIVGLRGVGKTTGIWQSIQKLSRYEDTVYINVLDDDAIEYSELYTFITKNYPDKRYIFVDEITFVRDFIKASKSLYEKFITNGKYVVISGTDSLALSQAKGNGLYHRIFIKNVTFISLSVIMRLFV